MQQQPTFTALEWTFLAGACEMIAARERARAAEAGGRAAQDYIHSAQCYERLARRCRGLAEARN